MNNETLKSTITPNYFLPFKLGLDGYPLPGKVVKYYREHKTYIDRDGKEKHWTQADLAKQLAISEIMVNLMENKNQGLDSIERRRALVAILKIPPVLLGLGSLDQIVEIVTGQDITSVKTDDKHVKIGRETINLYQNTFKVYESLFADGLTYANTNDIDKWTKRISKDVKNTDINNKSELLRILWNFEILCAKTYSSDFFDWNKAFEHLDNAMEIATLLENKDLQAASLYNAGYTRLRQGRPALAKVCIDGALLYANNALPQTKGAVYGLTAIYHAIDTNISSTILTQTMLDNAGKYAGAASEIKTIKFWKGKYLLDRSNTLRQLGRPAKAIDLLEDAKRYITKKRLLVYLDILSARCYMEMKKPEYEQAIRLLEDAIADSKEIRVQWHVDYIGRLYDALVASSYGDSPDVVELGMQLQELSHSTF